MRRKKKKKLCQIFSRDLLSFTVREVGFSWICCKVNRETQCWFHYIGELQTTYCENCKKNEQHFNIYLTTNGWHFWDGNSGLPSISLGACGKRKWWHYISCFFFFRTTFVLKFEFCLLLLSLTPLLECAAHLQFLCVFLYFRFNIFITLVQFL
jgi:hypothetical protein